MNDTQAYSKVLTLGSVYAKIQLGITVCRFIELSNPTIKGSQLFLPRVDFLGRLI